MLRSIKIVGLFDLFNYTIEFKQEGINILTGPNGFGKSTILKIIDAVSNQNFLFFNNLLFKEIILYSSQGQKINIIKVDDNIVEISGGNSLPIRVNKEDIYNKLENVIKDTPIRMIDKDRWIDRRTDQIFNTESMLRKFQPELLEAFKINFENFMPNFPKVYLIREQRLLRRVTYRNRINSRYHFLGDDETMDVFSEAIEEYSRELIELIKNTLTQYSQITQQLDSSFPRRLFDESREISEEEFNVRFERVKEIQKSLNKYELSDSREDNHPTYKRENAKALSVYLDDTEKKLQVFTELLEKLDLFTNILNKRRFTFKQIKISKENGFEFLTHNGHPLGLTNLSSGEQQEVILLFELLFKVTSNTLVLIDEPEISLHIAWQKEFLSDLSRIIDIKNIKVIVATHSPQIINEHWDLTIDLEEISHEAISE